MTMDEESYKLIQEIAYEEDITFTQAKECVEAEFDFTKKVIAKGEFECVGLPYFGKFWVDPRRVEHLNNKK